MPPKRFKTSTISLTIIDIVTAKPQDPVISPKKYLYMLSPTPHPANVIGIALITAIIGINKKKYFIGTSKPSPNAI